MAELVRVREKNVEGEKNSLPLHVYKHRRFFRRPNHDLSWHNVDDEFNQFAIDQLKRTDLFLWGRRIYQLMESYWPRASENTTMSLDDLEIARLMNNTQKFVFSRTLDNVSETKNWRNVTLIREFDPEVIRRLKEEPGKEIGVGGFNLALSLIKAGLIDELRIMVVPVVIGKGSTLFQGMEGKLNLELARTRRFNSGNLFLCYRPAERGNKTIQEA